MSAVPYDHDWVVVGSGFGGSVSALRLVERGYDVCVLEAGRRFTDDTLPKAISFKHLRSFLWLPRLGFRGVMRMKIFRNVSLVCGAGVGGGSLVYAAASYRGTDAFHDQLSRACGEQVDMAPFYAEAERMLGVTDMTPGSLTAKMLQTTADGLGYGDHVEPARLAVFLGEPGVEVPDPFFGGDGPARSGCTSCGQCIVSCRFNAKNSLDKNYLWFAERRGARIEAETSVVDIKPLGAADGADGYLVTTQRSGAWFRKRRRTIRTRGVVVSAGAIGTNSLLADCKHRGSLPALSERLGHEVYTNAESGGAITARESKADFVGGPTISASAWAPQGTHIESISYGGAGDLMGLAFVPLTGDGNKLTRPLKLVANILRHPVDAAQSSRVSGWSERSLLIGAMQPTGGAIRFVAKTRLLGRGVRLSTKPDPADPVPTYLPELHDAVREMAKQYDAVPQIWFTEALFNMPFTAHVLGGAVINEDPARGVIDARHCAHGYANLLVVDGSALPGNPGVNPSLSITAMAERAMSYVPAKPAAS